jgi:carbamoyltransferase
MMSKKITILGIYDGHDSGAAIVRDGVVLAAASEERLRAIKHYAGVPSEAIRCVLDTAKVYPSEINAIALAGHWWLGGYPAGKEGQANVSFRVYIYEKLSPYFSSGWFTNLQVKVFSRFRNIKKLTKVLSSFGLADKEIIIVEHHLAHAACAYRPCQFDGETLIFTCDGDGDGLSSTVSIGRNGEIRRIASSTYYHSVCNTLYSEVTGYLGMKRWDHEYKVMGLAPYGDPKYCMSVMKRIIKIDEKNPLTFKNTSGACDTQVYKKLRKWLDGARFDNIAAAVQSHYEKLLSTWVRNGVKSTGIGKIACAGGGFLNVKANKTIREIPEVTEAFFYPAAGDEGLAVGAALQAYYEFCRRDGVKPNKNVLRDLYYGPCFSDDDMSRSMKNLGSTNVNKFDDPTDEVVRFLLKGKVVGWFNGRMEFGPRALGCRSILADPRHQEIKRRLNSQIKMRDWFMPFAPSIIEEVAEDYLVNYCYAPYMILAFDTTERWNEIQAAVHPYDLTARPQVVRKEWNPKYWELIEAFHSETGVGAFLNTSFNLHGYPIVCTPEQALWTFENSMLDVLVLDNYVLTR